MQFLDSGTWKTKTIVLTDVLFRREVEVAFEALIAAEKLAQVEMEIGVGLDGVVGVLPVLDLELQQPG